MQGIEMEADGSVLEERDQSWISKITQQFALY